MRRAEFPESVGRYRLQSRLAAGGMGQVFLALDPGGQAVALKQLHPSIAYDDAMRKRLQREVIAMQRVRSSRVAQLLDADLEADPPYIVTRYIQGRTLQDVVNADGPLRGEPLWRVACGIAEALAAIHDAGQVHRDLKPANVMLVAADPIVIDFGIAHEQDATRITREGNATGTIGYMAPEVLDGGASGPPADVFAWGATVAYAATGRRTFGNGAIQSVALRTHQGNADLDGIDGELRPLLTAALAPDPAARPDARALIRYVTTPADRAAHRWPAPSPGRAAATAPPTPQALPAPQARAAPPVPSLATGQGPAVITRPGRESRRRNFILIGAVSAVALTAVSVFVIQDMVTDPPATSRTPAPSQSAPSQSAPARPTFDETIADWAAGKRFEQFLRANTGKKIYIGAGLGDSIIPQTSSGEDYDPSKKNDGALIMVWTSCFEKLAAAEEPTYEKCEGFETKIVGEQPAWAGLKWAHGVYSIQGNFEVAAGATFQGINTYSLKPSTAD